MIFNVRDNSIKYINGNEEETKFFDLETDKYCINEKDTFYHNDCVVYKNKIFCHGKESFHVFDMNSYSWKWVQNYNAPISHVNMENEGTLKKSISIKVERKLISSDNFFD